MFWLSWTLRSQFDEIQLREYAYRALQRPSDRDYESLLIYLSNSGDMHDDEEDWFLARNEMISLAPGVKNSWLDNKLEVFLRYVPFSQRIFTEKELRLSNVKDKDTTIMYFDRERIRVLSRMVSVLVASIAVAVPVYILTKLSDSPQKSLAVVIASTALFPLVLSVCARLGQNEVFAITAAYAAILVVFLSNSQNGSGGCACAPKA